MAKIAITLAMAVLMLGSLAMLNAAQSQQAGGASLRAQAQNASPLRLAGCRGWSAGCRAGTHRVCGPYHCWCRVC